MGTYVTDIGFVKKTLAEIVPEVEADLKSVFGENIDLDPDGNFGQLVGIISKGYADLWDLAEEIYNSRNVNAATGISLDNIVAENAIERNPATETTVSDVILEGDQGTVVALGKKARQQDTGIEYTLDAAVTIDKATARSGLISVTSIVVSSVYRVTIDSVNYDYTAVGGDTELDILNELETLITAGAWAGTASVDTTNEQLVLTDNDTDFDFDITGNLQIDEVGSAGNFTCVETGANTLAANTLNIVVTPVSGWDSVNNPSAGLTGTEVETDEELRRRRARSIVRGAATDPAIRTAVFDEVDNVTSVNVYSNRSDVTDGDGRPPHSFETVVQGGDDTEIAEKIFEKQPSGIVSYGNTQVNITDSQGYTQPIKFSRPEDVYIFVQIKRDYNTEETYPDNGDDLIKQAIVDWSLDPNNITIGKDVIRQRLADPIYTVPGIGDIEIQLDDSKTLPHTPTYALQNITINIRELAVFATDRISVIDFP